MAKESYVAVLGDEEEFGEFSTDRELEHEWNMKNLCGKLVRRIGLTTNRKEPKKAKVSVFRLCIVQGKLERRSAGSYEIDVPVKRMTSDEYNVAFQEILDEIPEEFWPFIRDTAYQRGHSSGHDEVISIAQEMMHDLKPCIEAFKLKSPKITVEKRTVPENRIQ